MEPLSHVIRSAQAGDVKAIEYLMSHYGKMVRQECEHYGLNGQSDLSGSDLSQEVLLQIWIKLHQFRGGDSDEHTVRAFESWLKLTARSVLCNMFRNRNAQKRRPHEEVQPYDENDPLRGVPQESVPTASSIFIQNENIEAVRLAMTHCLDEREREIVRRYVVEGQTFKEIADQLSRSYNEVRYTFNSACARMEKWLS